MQSDVGGVLVGIGDVSKAADGSDKFIKFCGRNSAGEICVAVIGIVIQIVKNLLGMQEN